MSDDCEVGAGQIGALSTHKWQHKRLNPLWCLELLEERVQSDYNWPRKVGFES